MMLVVKSFFVMILIGHVFSALSFKKIVVDVNPLAVINHGIKYKNIDNGILLNSTVEFLMDFDKVLSLIDLSVSFDVNSEKFDKSIFKSTTDFCRLSEGVLSNIFSKVFMENFKDAASYDLKCPYLKANYTIINQKITDNFIPGFHDIHFRFYSKMTGREVGKKKLIHIFTQTMYGNLQKNGQKRL